MPGRPTLVVFLGGMGGSAVEDTVAAACRAATLDTIAAAQASGAFAQTVLVSDDPSPFADLPAGAVLDADRAPFHFGRRLAGIIERYDLDAVVYQGGGSLPLLTADDFAAIARACEEEGVVVTNNFFSSDLVAFRPASALGRIEPPESDNALARALAEGAGLSVRALPRTVATQLDIDGPTDLAVLSLTGYGGPRLRAVLVGLALNISRYRRALALFTDRSAEIIVAGRVGSHAWPYLERETACRVRLFAEERGMQADGRARQGSARSLLGLYLDAVGSGPFFEGLSQLGDAAFIDTRVLLAHRGVEAGRADRFLSDLGQWRDIGEPFLREFTQAAANAAIPVLLGGHSLVSGGLMALNEFAWQEHDRVQSARDHSPRGPKDHVR